MVLMVQFLLLAGLMKFANSAVSLSLSSPTAAYFTITASVTIVSSTECTSGNLVLSNSGGTIYTADTLTRTIVSGTNSYSFTFYYKAAASGTVTAACESFSTYTSSQSITVSQGDLTFDAGNSYVIFT